MKAESGAKRARSGPHAIVSAVPVASCVKKEGNDSGSDWSAHRAAPMGTRRGFLVRKTLPALLLTAVLFIPLILLPVLTTEMVVEGVVTNVADYPDTGDGHDEGEDHGEEDGAEH